MGEKKPQFDRKLLKGVLGSFVALDTSSIEKTCVFVCVCVQVCRGVDDVTLPAAVMLLAIQVVVKRV